MYDGGSLEDYFKTIVTWLSDDANKNEGACQSSRPVRASLIPICHAVLSLVVTNNDNVAVATWADIFKSSGLEQFVYTPPSAALARSDWPKMSELISANTRVVVFMDYNADPATVPYILPEFDNASSFHAFLDVL